MALERERSVRPRLECMRVCSLTRTKAAGRPVRVAPLFVFVLGAAVASAWVRRVSSGGFSGGFSRGFCNVLRTGFCLGSGM